MSSSVSNSFKAWLIINISRTGMIPYRNCALQWKEWTVRSLPVLSLVVLLSTLLVDAIREYAIPPEKADYVVPAILPPSPSAAMEVDDVIDPQLTRAPPTEPQMRSNLRLFPPPLFSRQTIAQAYKYAFLPILFPLFHVAMQPQTESRLYDFDCSQRRDW